MSSKIENKFIKCLIALRLIKRIENESNQSLNYKQQSKIIVVVMSGMVIMYRLCFDIAKFAQSYHFKIISIEGVLIIVITVFICFSLFMIMLTLCSKVIRKKR